MTFQSSTHKTSGVLVVDKPTGMSDREVVNIVRSGMNMRRVGHVGALDPRASGVLVVLAGASVRLSRYLAGSEKRYQVTITLQDHGMISDDQIARFLEKQMGNQTIMVPPKRGAPLGAPNRPQEVEVTYAKLVENDLPDVTIDLACSHGSFVKHLADRFGKHFGCGARLIIMRRTKSGRFTLRDAVPLRKLQESFRAGNWYQYLVPPLEALKEFPSVEFGPKEAHRLTMGNQIRTNFTAENVPVGLHVALNDLGETIALIEAIPTPDRVEFPDVEFVWQVRVGLVPNAPKAR